MKEERGHDVTRSFITKYENVKIPLARDGEPEYSDVIKHS